MKLIKELEKRKSPNHKDHKVLRWGIFLCPVCKKKAEKDYHNGIRQKACGCTQTTHGEYINNRSGNRLVQTWHSMKNRCYGNDPNHCQWYKSKGIIVCEDWKNDFVVFKNWALNNGYRDNLQIDRKNNSGNYCPENCQFLTPAENSRKRPNTKLTMKKARRIRLLFKRGTSLSQRDVAECYGVKRQAISKVLKNQRWVESERLN